MRSPLLRHGLLRSATSRRSTALRARRWHTTDLERGTYKPIHIPKERDFSRRGFTVGIGGPVGSGKTALVRDFCQRMQGNSELNLGIVTNDIFTQEDADFLVRNKALAANRIRAVETGGCPHAAIREDVSANLTALEDLTRLHSKNDNDMLLLCESGGDNLAANFSRELADLTIYVIDVAGGDKVPRKGGPGITESDLLVINKVDLAPHVGADLEVMKNDAAKLRTRWNPTVFASVKTNEGMEQVSDFILHHFGQRLKRDRNLNH